MIDVHSHILPNIDDGSRSIEEIDLKEKYGLMQYMKT